MKSLQRPKRKEKVSLDISFVHNLSQQWPYSDGRKSRHCEYSMNERWFTAALILTKVQHVWRIAIMKILCTISNYRYPSHNQVTALHIVTIRFWSSWAQFFLVKSQWKRRKHEAMMENIFEELILPAHHIILAVEILCNQHPKEMFPTAPLKFFPFNRHLQKYRKVYDYSSPHWKLISFQLQL